MSDNTVKKVRRVTTLRFQEMKDNGEKISMLTSYDYTMATLVDKAGIDAILVGDSASNVVCGNETTVPITVENMIYHAKAVVKAAKRSLVICDMPFGSYQVNSTEGVSNAIKIMKKTGCGALKLEGGIEVVDTIKKIIDCGIPVMGHLGLTPQSINKFGTYTVRAKEEAEAKKLVSDAHALQKAGCFAITLEKIPAELAAKVAKELTIPIIGIGAGNDVDGQVLVVSDMLGMSDMFKPRFIRHYANLKETIVDAIGNYISDVKSKDFPNKSEQY